MKIDYDLSKNYFSKYIDSQGVVLKKKKILKGESVKVGYFRDGMIFLIGFIIMLAIDLIFRKNVLADVDYIIDFIVSAYGIIVFTYFISLFIAYLYDRLSKHYKGTMEFNDEGIIDKCVTGKSLKIDWKNVSCLAISDKTVVFITTKAFYFFLSIEYKDEVLKAIKKYNKSLKIIELNKKD